jgi:8-oxo-dGTP pyrophosphatase MutT (NUDIX family)
MGKQGAQLILLALPIAALRMTTVDVAAVRAAAAPFSCAILRRGDQFLAEVRGADAQAAAGRLTCYGGKRERGETSLQCVVRELNEELGWAPDDIPAEPACSLLVDGYLIAHFYEASVDRTDFVTEGRSFEFVDASDERWSPWHARVLAARGDAVAIFDDGGDPSATLALLRAVPTAGEEGLERRYYEPL